jgi:hypothetical protein
VKEEGREKRTDVDLRASDVVRPTIERSRLREASDRVLDHRVRRRERTRSMSADGAVVDYPSTLRRLVFHDSEGMLGAEEGGDEVDVDDGLEVGEGDVFERDGGEVSTSVIEDEIKTTYRRVYDQ